jgi:hypothetical protein
VFDGTINLNPIMFRQACFFSRSQSGTNSPELVVWQLT